MPKAVIKLANGTIVEIDGSPEEIKNLLGYYGLGGEAARKKSVPVKSGSLRQGRGPTVPDEVELARLVNLVRTCEETEGIETHILDRPSEVNHVLLPLYIVHEQMDDAFGLTTVEIASVTTDLGIRVFRQNVLRTVKGSGARYVIGDRVRRRGQGTRYRLNRRGILYMRGVIRGGRNAD